MVRWVVRGWGAPLGSAALSATAHGSRSLGAAALATLVAVSASCGPPPTGAPSAIPAVAPAATGTATATTLFIDRSATSGVDFVHEPCRTGKKLLVEINSGGVSLLDYDGDGDLDLFFGQGAPLPGFDATHADLRDRLYRNDGAFHFTDVTAATGASDSGYTYAAACPDIDGDGDPDLYLVNAGRNTWLRNDVATSGRFVDVTADWGGNAPEWSTAAAFVDFDQDNDLDLYVVNYVDLALDHPGCGNLELGEKGRTYCHPDEFPPTDDRLYRNDDGRFVDVSDRIALKGSGGAGLGAVPCDYDLDGDVDLFVANDSTPNFLWRNDGNWTLRDVASEAWVAVDGSGVSTAAMGSDFGDVDGDGDFDLVVANLAMEMNTLYRNDGAGRFDDRSTASGFGPPSLLFVGFGCELFDADLDGDQDALIANGHVIDNVELYEPAQTFRQPPLLMRNEGGGRFKSLGAEAGSYFAGRSVGRGLAVGDLDNDGDLDAVVAHWDARPALLENTTNGARPWIGLQLVGAGKNRQAIGALVTVEAGGHTLKDEVRGTSSYAAFADLRLVFGLGAATQADRVTIRWPDGRTTSCGPLAAGRYHAVREASE